MKTIEEMNEQEILALTNEDLNTMVMLKMAQDGIKIIDKPGLPNYIAVPSKDRKMYKVRGFNFVFDNMEDAEIISAAIVQVRERLNIEAYPDGNYEIKFANPYSEKDYSFTEISRIESVEVYKRETAYNIQDNVKQNAKLKNQYEAALKEYNENYESAQYIRDDIFGAFNKVNDKYKNFNAMKYRLDQYLPLAENNVDIAMNFLKKAYVIDAETEEYILSKTPVQSSN